jgi:hypothetical protein
MESPADGSDLPKFWPPLNVLIRYDWQAEKQPLDNRFDDHNR